MSFTLTPKPFSASARIIKAIFGGKPQITADVDLNRQFESLRFSLDTLWSILGPSMNKVFTHTSTYDPATKALIYSITWEAFSIVYRGMQFDLNAGTVSGTTVATNYPSIRLYLVGVKSRITFADDAVMSGISSTSLPAPLPGAEHEVYTTYRLIVAELPDAPLLNVNEEVITRVATVIPIRREGVLYPTLYSLTNSAYSSKLKAKLGDIFDTSSGLIELNQYVLDYMFNYLKEPIGTWKGYHGALAGNFDNTGLGINQWTGWAIFNGANGTDDWRGRTPFMYDPRLSDPGGNVWGAHLNTIGTKFGEKEHILTDSEMPEHGHHTWKAGGGDKGLINNGTDTPGLESSQGTSLSYRIYGYNNNVDQAPANIGLTSKVGGDAPHNNLPPGVVTCFVLRIS